MKTATLKLNSTLTHRMKLTCALLLAALVLAPAAALAGNTRFAVATGNWNSTGTWSATSGGASGASVPIAGDTAFITAFTVTVSDAEACATLNVTTNATAQLHVTTGSLTNSATTTINNSANITVDSAGWFRTATLTDTSGTFTNNGTTTATGGSSGAGSIVNGTNATLTYGGTVGITTQTYTAAGNTVIENASGNVTPAAVPYVNLTIVGQAASNFKPVSGVTSISGTLTLGGAMKTNALGASSTIGNIVLLSTFTSALTNGASETIGGVTVAGGTFFLPNNNDISSTGILTIGAGGTYDVSAWVSAYTLPNATAPFTASGTGTSGTTAAYINGSAGASPFSLSTHPVNLIFTPTSFTGDTTHPTLVVSNCALTLNNNAFTITNNGGTLLGIGIYNLIQVNNGTGTINQNGSPAYTVNVYLPGGGNGLASGDTAAVSVSGGNVVLTVFSGVPSTNAYLKSLVLSPNVGFAPGFTTNGYLYNATNSYGQTPTVTVTNADFTATNTLIVNGVSLGILTNHVASVPLTLGVGNTNVVSVRVVSQDLSVTNTYVVDVTMLPQVLSTNAYLKSLVLSPNVGFAPGFTTNGYLYNATNSYGQTPTVTVTNADATATNALIVNGVSLGLLTNSVASVPLTLGVGNTNVVSVQVVSQDLSQTNLYVVDVTVPTPPITWAGGSSGYWSDTGNWAAGVVPTNGSSLIFSGTTGQSNTNDISGLTNLVRITFTNAGWNISGNSLAMANSTSITNGFVDNGPGSGGTNIWGLDTTLSSGWVNITNNYDTLIFSGVLSGAGGLAKCGTNGTVILSGANTYSGGTSNALNGGAIQLGNGGATGSAGSGSITLVRGGANATNYSLAVNETGSPVFPNALVLPSGNQGIYVNSGQTAIFTNSISGGASTGSPWVNGPGTLVITNPTGGASYSQFGTTISSGGVLQIDDLAEINTKSTFMVNGGGTCIWAGPSVNESGHAFFANGSAFQGAGTFVINIANPSTIFGCNDAVGQTKAVGTFIKTGPGTLTLFASSPYTNNTIIANGTLALSGSGAIPNSIALSIAAGGTFDFSGLSAGYTLPAATLSLTASGTGLTSATAAVVNGNGNTFSLSSRTNILTIAPTSTADTTHPALLVTNCSQLTLVNNPFMITNNSGSPLTAGTYRLIQVGDGVTGTISGTPGAVNVYLPGGGNGLVSGATAAASTISGNVVLTVQGGPGTTNAYLTSLVLSPNVGFAPTFTTNGYLYYATNSYGQTPTVTVTNADFTATNTLIVNGVSLGLLTNSVASVPLTLGVGNTNVVQVQVVDLTVTNTYVVDVTMQGPSLSNNANLTSLVLNPNAGFAPSFTTGGYLYYATNNYGDTPTVTVTNADLTATNMLIVNGVSLGLLTNSVASVPLTLGVGNTNVVSVQVVSQDLSVTNTYAVAVTLQGPSLSTNAQLTSLALTPAGTLYPTFATGTTSYTATNTCANNPLTVTVTNADVTATNWLIYNGATNGLASGATSAALTLVTGANTVTVQVVSQDLSVTNDYVVAVTLTAPPTVGVNSTNIYAGGSATLTATTSASSPAYSWSPGGATTASITVSPSTNTTYTVTVTDGTTGCVGGGSGTVTILPSTNALLASLSLTPAGTLAPTFASGTTSYNATNTYANNPVTVAAGSADANATLALNLNGGGYGAAVTNSLSVPNNTLVLPTNTVAVRVVSQDLSQTNTYTVNVLLQPSATVPKLTNSVSGSTLTLTWPADHLGYRLLVQTNNLNKGVSGNINDWGTVAGSDTITSTNIAIIKAGVTNMYYKLVYP